MFEKQNISEKCLTLTHWKWVLETAKLQKEKEIEIKNLSKAQKTKVRDEQFDLGRIASVIFPSQTFDNIMLELNHIIELYTRLIDEEIQKNPKFYKLYFDTEDKINSSKNTIKEIESFLAEHKNWKEKNIHNKTEIPSFTRYEIEKREYSSNVLVGVYLGENGKEKRKQILSTHLPKKENDEFLNQMLHNFSTMFYGFFFKENEIFQSTVANRK